MMKSTLRLGGILIVLLSISLTACERGGGNGGSGGSGSQGTFPAVNKNPKFNLQGFNLTAWDKNGWDADMPIDEALKFAVDEGANFLALDWAVNFNDDGTMVAQGGSSHPSWDDIKTAVNKAKAMGFYLMLKPHVTMATSPENRNIWNTDTATFLPSNFFPAWKVYLSDLGKFAAQNNVDAICFGTEMNHLDWQFREDWVDLIGSVRLNFTGAVTYDALFSLFDEVKDLKEVVFWDQVDFIGCSLYVPITLDDNASVDTLKQGWINNSTGNINNVINYLRSTANLYGKPLMALEGGYQSANSGLYDVNSSPAPDKVVNNDLQSRGLDAYLSVLYENKEDWLKGVSLWQITPAMMTPQGLASIYHTQEFTVYQKPAAEVVKRHYTLP